MLQFAHLFTKVAQETLKSITHPGFNYFLSRKSYYPNPAGSSIPILTLPKVPHPSRGHVSKDDLHSMVAWSKDNGKSVAQKTVRNKTCNPGTLPISCYSRPDPTPEPLKIDIDALCQWDHKDSDSLMSNTVVVVSDVQPEAPWRDTFYVVRLLEDTTGATHDNIQVQLFEFESLQFTESDCIRTVRNDAIVNALNVNGSQFTLSAQGAL